VGSCGPAGGALLLRPYSGLLEHGPGMHEGCGPSVVEIVCVCGSLVWQAFGARSWHRSCVPCLWIAGLAGLKGAAWWSRDRAGLFRPEGLSPEEIVNACGSPALQALGAEPSLGEIMQACAVLRGTAQWRS
jgi:hypothetical protein